MNTKTINFEYNGGTYTQNLNIKGTNLPWRYECDDEWVDITTTATSITVSVQPTYNYEKRECTVCIFDKFDNKLMLHCVQSGYMDLKVECSKQIVLYHSYYDVNDYMNAYVTVYGGRNQELICSELEEYITKVWDNSSMFNDFVIRIPETLRGRFTIRHKDADKFIRYCKKNKLPFNADNLEKTIDIVQVSADDVIGKMIINVNGTEYKSGDKCDIVINSKDYTDIEIVSTSYTHVVSNTKYEIVNDKLVDPTKMAYWVDYTNKPGLLRIKSNEFNNFDEQTCTMVLVNHTNAHQRLEINIRQPKDC